MNELERRIAALPPDRRTLLEKWLRDGKASGTDNQPISHDAGSGPRPLSYAQQRLWFLAQLAPESPLYNVGHAVHIQGPLNIPALQRALTAVVARHYALRTTFGVENGAPVQIVNDPREVPLPTVDLQSICPERDSEVQRSIVEQVRRPFNPSEDLMIRACMLRLDNEEHVLVLTLHHIASDAWSSGILYREIASFYEAFIEGKTVELPPLTIQYPDYAVWQRRRYESNLLESQLAYWRNHLDRLPPLLELPSDRPRPAIQSHCGERLHLKIDRDLTDGLRRLSRSEGTTLYMTLLAAFQTLLHRYTGRDDIVVGAVIAGRERVETESLIGFFVNTLVMRTDLTGNPTFREVLGRVREVSLQAFANREIPFEKVVEVLQPQRSMAHTPLFQIAFVLQNTPKRKLALPGLDVSPCGIDAQISKFDLTLAVTDMPGDEELDAYFEFNTDILDRPAIARMSECLLTLLQNIVDEPGRSVSTIPLVSHSDLVSIDARKRKTYPPGRCIHQWFEDQAAATPEAIAVVHEDRKWTYGELNSRANKLARILRRSGVGPEVLTGIYLERSADLIVAVIATLKAGGAYVPIDTAYPAERIAFILSDANPVVLVSQKILESRIPAHRGSTVLMDVIPELEAESSTNLHVEVSANNLAYVIYTSGSTGTPKGTLVTHYNVVRLFQATERAFAFNPSDVWTLFHSCAFDFSVWEMWGALFYGGRLVVVPYLVSRETEAFYELILREGVTVLNQTPSAFRQLAAHDSTKGQTALPLRLVIFGGEALQPGMLKPWFEKHGNSKPAMVNMYGITETTVHVTLKTIAQRDLDRGSNIGKPIEDLEVFILDPQQQPVPTGVAGEICVGGAGVSRGYLSREELTSSRFLRVRMGETETRLYRSGDVGRRLANGDIEYLGRLDSQIKVRGFRVELGEIETILSQHASIRDTVVVYREVRPGEQGIVAYVTCLSEPATETDLRDFLRQRLPEYMIPAAFVLLDKIPLTAHGKTHFKALPNPVPGSLPQDKEYVAPRTPIEARVAKIWSEVLHRSGVGIRDNFFNLGGHSLLATQVIARIQSAFHTDFPLRRLFEAPTVEALSQILLSEYQVASTADGVDARGDTAVAPRRDAGPCPLSFAQQRLWFLAQLEPDSPLYNVPTVLRITGELNVAALQKTINAIVARHEVLRTTFHTLDGQPVQIVTQSTNVEIPIVDRREDEPGNLEGWIDRLSREESCRPFNLSKDLMIRARMLRIRADEHVLLVTLHHIVSDGWSIGVLNREIAAGYQAFAEGRELRLPDLPIQYTDYAAWQRRHLLGERLDSQLSYWKKQLDGLAPTLSLPTDRPRPNVQRYRGAKHPFSFPRPLSEQLRQLSRREGVTLYMTLLAGFQTLLHRYTSETDIAVGSPIANRGSIETENLIGFFVNTLVMRTDFSGDPPFTKLLNRVRETALGAYAHQDLPFERLVEALQPERSLSHNPLFQVLFVMQNAPREEFRLSNLGLRPRTIDTGTAKFDLTLSMREDGDRGLSGSLEYCTDLFDATTIERMCGHLQTLLESAVANPECIISKLEIIPGEERRQILDEWNADQVGLDENSTIHGMFENQVRETPAAIALEFSGSSLTYEELNRRANALAIRLRSEGVRRGAIVAMLFERSIEMYVALLAILKAGGAYLPLSTSDPTERLGFMLADARAKILVTHPNFGRKLGEDLRIVRFDSRDSGSAQNPPNSVSSADSAYVLYTPGSAEPKPVCMPHGPLVNLIHWQRQTSTLRGVRTLQFTPLTFDVSSQEIFSTWCRGGSLVGIPDETRRDPVALLAMLRSENINCLFVPCVALQQLAEASAEGRLPDSLKEVYTAGKQLFITPAISRFFRALPDCTLHNHYGPTESHVVTAYTLPADRDRWEYRTPIGRPITNARIYILDRHDRPVPVGVPGELHIGGSTLARGHLNRIELTVEQFVPDPFGQACGRMYRTGDIARYLANGTIEFLGRKDHQVKLRGYRIEPGEIENVLERHPAVRQAVVITREDNKGYPRLVAYTLRAEGREYSSAELQAFLSGQLPDYMIPIAFVPLETFPLTDAGRIDRKALPFPFPEGLARASFTAPRSALEEILSGIWAEVLNLERVSIDDNFFSLGGHSLLATRAASRIREILRVKLPLRQIFESPTIERLALAMLSAEQKPGRIEKIAAIALRVSSLSAEEADRRLEQIRRQEQPT